MHVAVMGVVTAVVALGGINAVNSERSGKSVANTAQGLITETGHGGIVDNSASAYIAADVATALELPVADKVAQHAQNISNQVTNTTAGSQYAVKTQTVTSEAAANIGVKTYTVQEGDTVASVAQKFNVSAATVADANELSENARLIPGTNLVILPVNGLLHTVAANDTAETIASRYQVSAAQVIAFNDLEVSGLTAGATIIIPNGVKPRAAAPSVVLASGSSIARYGGNGYDYGYCTWYAKNKRPDLPSNLGNAISWLSNAAASGYSTGANPVAGAVAWERGNHVAIVDSVNGDGSVTISEMNYAGWGVVSRRTVPAGTFLYIY